MVSYPSVDKDIELATLKRELYAKSHNQNSSTMGRTRKRRRGRRRKNRSDSLVI